MDKEKVTRKFGNYYYTDDYSFIMGIDIRFSDHIAQRSKNRIVLETCSGAGFTTISLAKYAKHVYSVEIDKARLETAKKKLLMAKQENKVSFLNGDVTTHRILNLLLGIIILFSSLPAIGQIDGNFRENQKKAFIASSKSECESSLKFCNEVLKIVPNQPIINYLSARLNALLGNDDIALKLLQKATLLGYTTKLPFNKIHHLNDTAFSFIREKEEFKEIIETLKLAEEPIHKSQIAFTISEKELIPEGIAYDPVEKMFYLGSETKGKIIKVDQYGKVSNFTLERQDGLNILLGLHVDSIRRTLWVCSYEENKQAIFKYSLSSEKLIKKYLLSTDSTGAYFNDLVIHPNGDIYISDPEGGGIYTIPHSTNKIELFFKNDLLVSPNGITLSEDGQNIFVGDTYIGIHKINIKTKSTILLSHEPDFCIYGIDGLYLTENYLYAVEILLNRITRYSLNKVGNHIESCEFFERNGPYLDKPTTGVIVDDYFYFIADTQGKGNKLEGIIIMKAPLK